MLYIVSYLLHPIGEVRTNLIIYIKEKRRPLHTPSQVCDNLHNYMQKPTHMAHTLIVMNLLLFPLSRSQFEMELSICSWVLPTNTATKVDINFLITKK